MSKEQKTRKTDSDIISKLEVKRVLSDIVRGCLMSHDQRNMEYPKASERIAAAKMLYPILDVQEGDKRLSEIEKVIKGK